MLYEKSCSTIRVDTIRRGCHGQFNKEIISIWNIEPPLQLILLSIPIPPDGHRSLNIIFLWCKVQQCNRVMVRSEWWCALSDFKSLTAIELLSYHWQQRWQAERHNNYMLPSSIENILLKYQLRFLLWNTSGSDKISIWWSYDVSNHIQVLQHNSLWTKD